MEVCVGHLGLVWHWGSRTLKESHPLTQKYTFMKRLYSIQEGPLLLCVLESSGNHLKTESWTNSQSTLFCSSGVGPNNLHLRYFSPILCCYLEDHTLITIHKGRVSKSKDSGACVMALLLTTMFSPK